MRSGSALFVQVRLAANHFLGTKARFPEGEPPPREVSLYEPFDFRRSRPAPTKTHRDRKHKVSRPAKPNTSPSYFTSSALHATTHDEKTLARNQKKLFF